MKTILTMSSGRFNHCSSIVTTGDNILIAWYSGDECSDDQTVNISCMSHDKVTTDHIYLEPKTGNPILFKHKNDIIIIYSEFESDTVSVKRWCDCSLWARKISVSNNTIAIGDRWKITDSGLSLLPRCKPLHVDDQTILPLYDERSAKCVIYKYDNGNCVKLSEFGDQVIQPTLFYDGTYVHAFCRNFGNGEIFSRHYVSDNFVEWYRIHHNLIYNNNSSLCTIYHYGKYLVLWNNTAGVIRSNLTLGEMTIGDDFRLAVKKIEVISADHGSYPSMCSHNEKLLISFTRNGEIVLTER